MGNRYAFTDIHGQWDLWQQIKEYCAEDDELYFLGDAVDRGPDGVKIMLDMLADKRVVYIKGNHEDLMERAMNSKGADNFFDLANWSTNGGDVTRDELRELGEGTREQILNGFAKMHLTYALVNANGQMIFLSHAGVDMHNLPDDEDKYFWDRTHMYSPWSINPRYENWYVVHGHTPCQLVDNTCKYNNCVLNYCEGHKFDLDIASFLTNKIALFNLDTLDIERYFYQESKEKINVSEQN